MSATRAADQLLRSSTVNMPARLLVVVHHDDRDVAEQLDRLLDDVEVAEVDRVEAAGVEHGAPWVLVTVAALGGCSDRGAGT